MKAAAKAIPKTIYTQRLNGIDKDIARCMVLHAQIKKQLATVKKDSASRA